MRRRDLSKALLASAATTTDSLATPIQARAQESAEQAAGIVPENRAFPFGDLRRYGGDPTGAADSSAAWQAAVDCGYAVIPPAATFRILKGATHRGPITVLGCGPSSKLLCDGDLLTVINGTGSCMDNLWLENITAPWIVTREPRDWSANILGTLRRSNTEAGYQPTVNDEDIWHHLTPEQQNQQIGPEIQFRGAATNIAISRIYGRFVRIDLMDAQYSTVRDCNFRGGKGTWGGINIDNAQNLVQRGRGNSAVGNTVRQASFSGIVVQNNEAPLVANNITEYCGESGIKIGGTVHNTFNTQAVITGNQCNYNFYDGIDLCTRFPPDDSIAAYHLATGNSSCNNGGDGINLDGRYNQCIGNVFRANGRFAIWCTGSYTAIKDNICIDNNRSHQAACPEILGGKGFNSISGNFISAGEHANSPAILARGTHFIVDNQALGANFEFGTPATAFLANNSDPTTGLQVEQSFTLRITNKGGTLQHTTVGNFQSRILNASPEPHATPSGPDRTTSLVAGWKINGEAKHQLWADTNDQLNAGNGLLIAAIAYNDTGSALTVRPQIVRAEINGVSRFRLLFQFHSGAQAFALDTKNIPPGNTVEVQFYGKLA
jgi:hypothetical protein